MRKVISIILMVLVLTGCSGKTASTPFVEKEGPRFVKLSDEGTFEIYVDTVTDIQYAVSDSPGNMGTVTLLVDKNGYPLVWKGE
jgi:PBP1b-binding outer membrane lipoprotein LpoB